MQSIYLLSSYSYYYYCAYHSVLNHNSLSVWKHRIKPFKWISDWWSISQNATSAKCVCLHVCVHTLGWCWAVAGLSVGEHTLCCIIVPTIPFSSWSYHQAAFLLSVTLSLPAFEFDALLLVQVLSVVLECWTPFILRQTKGADRDFSRKFRNINCYFSVKIFLSF